MLQLCDTAFPSGSLANSLGLESALAHGLVTRNADDSLPLFCCLTLEQLAHQALPFVRAAHAASKLEDYGLTCLAEIDHVCSVVTVNEVSRRASLNQGRCFLRATSAAFSHRPHAAASISALSAGISSGRLQGHYSVVFGAVCGALDVSARCAERMLLRCALRDLASCAARLNVLGPLEGANLQARLGETVVEQLLRASPSAAPPGDASSIGSATILTRLMGDDAPRLTAPVLDLVQARHDLLYARLFNS